MYDWYKRRGRGHANDGWKGILDYRRCEIPHFPKSHVLLGLGIEEYKSLGNLYLTALFLKQSNLCSAAATLITAACSSQKPSPSEENLFALNKTLLVRG